MEEGSFTYEDILYFWESRWGKLEPIMRDKFLNEHPYTLYLSYIVKFREHQIKFCINKEKRLSNILSLLQLTYANKKKYRKGAPPGFDRYFCRHCSKSIDSGTICEECSIEQEIRGKYYLRNTNSRDAFRDGNYHSDNLGPREFGESFVESHIMLQICLDCDSGIDDEGFCECKPRPTWR